MTENQETSTPSSSTTASMTIQVEGVGKPSAARSMEIAQVVEEFLMQLEHTNAWHVTLRATLSV